MHVFSCSEELGIKYTHRGIGSTYAKEDCTEAGIMEALTIVQEADNKSEPLYTSTPKRRQRYPKMRSQKCYRYLRSILKFLPTESTLKLTLRKVDMDVGITDSTKQRLKEAAAMATSEKELTVVLIWDELLLGLGLAYNDRADKIIGLEDWGTVRTERLADHALLFMIRSIESGDSLPVSFNFCDSTKKNTQLQFCMKEVVKALKDVGFNVTATLCDGARTNEAAIKDFFEDTKRVRGSEYVNRYGTFIVHGVEIIPLFDPLHLLKCIRNNLLDKDLEINRPDSKKGEMKFAKREHVIIAYEINTYGRRKLPALHKLTEQHVYCGKIRKMSCKLCNQVFSGILSAEIQTLAGGPGWAVGAEKLLRMPIESRVTGNRETKNPMKSQPPFLRN